MISMYYEKGYEIQGKKKKRDTWELDYKGAEERHLSHL